MIIEKIHIDNFGKLSDYTIEFKNGLNTVFGNNEDGKTTIMSFIRLMFYADCGKKSDICFNIRHRFRPFSQKEMGGSIDFSHDGKNYTLIKRFGKTARGDKVMLLDRALGKEIPLSAERELGEIFFSLSSDAFERSIYVGSLPITGDDGYAELSSKLAAAVYTGDTGDSFEEIDERLAAAQLSMRTPRGVGSADKLSKKLDRLNALLDDSRKTEQERITAEQLIEKEKDRIVFLEKELSKKRDALVLGELKKEAELRRERDVVLASLGGFTKERLLYCEELLRERDNISAVLSAAAEIAAEKTEQNGVEATQKALQNEIEKVENIKALILENKQKADAVSAEKPQSAALFFVAAVLFLLSAACGSFASLLFLLMLAPAALFLILGITKTSEQKKRFADNEAARASLEEEEDALQQQLTEITARISAYNERLAFLKNDVEKQQKAIERTENERKAANERLKAIKAELLTLCPAGLENIREFLITAEENLQRQQTVCALLENSRHKNLSDEELKTKLSADTGIFATASEIEAIARELENLKVGVVRREGEVRTLFLGKESVAVLERSISGVEEQLKKQNAHYECLSLAREQLAEAYYEMRRNFAPELNRLTAEYFSAITDGKYSFTTVSNEFSVLVNDTGDMPYSSEYLSSGSRDQLDLCLRLALARLTSGENRLPLMLDDVLMQYDEGRAAVAMKLISDYSEDTQVLHFTCHKHIAALADIFGANQVRL